MYMRRWISALAWLSLLALANPAAAVQPKQESGPLDRLAVTDPRLRPASAVQPIEEAGAAAVPGLLDGWNAFQQDQGGGWQGYVDRRSGLLGVAEGPGIPWIPGPGNQLSGAVPADLGALESVARAFLPRVSSLLGVDPRELVLSQERSGRAGDQVWFVDFDVKRSGRILEGARIVFRVSHGNLVQLGAENLPSPGQGAPAQESVRREDALATLTAHIRGFGAADTFLDGGSLHLLPVALADDRFTEGFEAGQGRGLALVWEFVFHREKETGTWRARIDAVTGDLLELVDTNRYARAQGGVYPVSYSTSPETVLPMPFLDLSSGGSTNSSGVYTYPGSPVTSHLYGPYVQIYDYCGAIALTSSGSGRLSFGTSGGTDCVTPGVGGTGNTHASRTQFYHVNRVKEVGRAWLPSNSWLQEQLLTVVNIWDTCNAYWNGYSVNFYRSGGNCGNTGEAAAISLHEYGHGLDENDGPGFSPDNGTGEAYADITAAMMLRDSCIGPGFFLSSNCDGDGDACTSCSGVRDIDWAKHASNTPHTVGNFTQVRCPALGFYEGPCGRQGHCESHVISEAVWDLAARDLPGAGTNQAWAVAERLWYLSRPTSTSAFTCNTSTNPWTSNGCAAGSLWRTMRAIDDDDGNLANGTPHSCHLFAAFDRHGIACATDPGANVCFSACTPPAAPTLSATAGQEEVQLAWTGGGGLVYDVYESEMGCSSGWRRIANDLPANALLDTTVFFGRPHSYQVIAHAPGAEACASAPSSCQTATPTGPPCTPPAPPATVTAQALGVDKIRITWSAAAGASDYQIWRAPAAGGPYAQVALVAAPATTWTDLNLAMGTTYFYVVRSAFDDCVSGDSAVASATTPTCMNTTLYTNDFETGSGLSDWIISNGSSPDWRGIQTCSAHSGNRIFRFGGPGCSDNYQNSQFANIEPQSAAGIQIPAAAATSRLSFWHRWNFEPGFDGGLLFVNVGLGPVYVPAYAFLSGGYNDSSQFTGPQNSFIRSEVDLDRACAIASFGTFSSCEGRNVRIGFTAHSDSIFTDKGWYLDDVTVTSCVLHGCTGAPQIGAAAAAGDNQIQVTWSNGSPASSSFNVYRALGTCAQHGPFEKVASGVAGFAYLDAPVSGGVSWAYQVTGLDSSGLCESDASGCVEATTTGACTVPPAFAGLASATNAAAATCGIDLSWPAATSRCGNGVTYDVYRSIANGFTPGPESWIASGISGTSWHDEDALEDGMTYHYVVRAVDSGNGQPESNTQQQSTEPTGVITPWSLSETFEGAGGFDNPGWTHAALSGPADWVYSTGQVHSPTHSWLSPSQSFSTHRALVSPSFGIEDGTTLSFWHTYEMEQFSDGGTLEISTDGGASWTVLSDSAFLAGGFDAALHFSSNPIGGLRAWTGGTFGPMTQVTADLSLWEGARAAKLRWHGGEDSSTKYTGWYVDDVAIDDAVQIAACQPAPAPELDFYTLAPCRVVDTRNPAGPSGGPALQAGAQRAFVMTGSCGVPPTARALSLNLTTVQPAAPGNLVLFPTGVFAPPTNALSFVPGQNRANLAVAPLGLHTGALVVKNNSAGTVHLVIDVTGYFE